MTTTQITRTEQSDTTTWTAWIDSTDAAELVIWTATREIANVETRSAYQRQGLASALWTVATAEGQCFHSLDHHRTPAGESFARSVGGQTVTEDDGYQAECAICTHGDDDEEEH